MANYLRYKKVTNYKGVRGKDIDYKDIENLKLYLMDNGRIISSRINGLNPKQQRGLTRAVKIARFLALLKYTDKH